MQPRHVLAADIGGTKTLLRLARLAPDDTHTLYTVHQANYASAAYADFTLLLEDFLAGCGARPDTIGLAIAGPVNGQAPRQHARLTNLPWQLDSAQLARHFSARVLFINDFQAIGHGIPLLESARLTTLHAATRQAGAPAVVLGAGTGLGVALLLPCDGQYVVLPTEAGHMDFAPGNALQDGLLAFLRRELGHVSWERVLSGPGLANMYRYLLSCNADADEENLLAQADPPAAIAGSMSPLARSAMEQFVQIYGAMAGNLALACLARGGVYLAGGIAAKILPQLAQGGFVSAYLNKGRMQKVVADIPVHVVTDPEVGLLGALALASRIPAE